MTCYIFNPTADCDIVSAVHKVFDTPELLEQILICFAACHERTPISTTYLCMPLFVLQRVNQNFNATIARSLPIRRRMMLAQEDDDNKRRSYGADFVFQDRKDLLSFVRGSYRQQVCDTINSRSNPEKHCVVTLHSSEYQDPGQSTTAWRLPTSTMLSTNKQSWRGMKLCSHPQTVSVFLCMSIEPGMSYLSMLAFDQGDETLGTLNDAVEKVLSRNRDEHIKYMRVYRKVSV